MREQLVIPFGLAFGLAMGLTTLVRVLALRAGWVDRPRPDRWHQHPVPRLGGIAIYAAFMSAAFVFSRPWTTPEMQGLLGGATAIFLVGLLDDFVRLETRPKLILLIVCAVIPPLAGVRFEMVPPIVGTPLAIIWILGATNAFNWLDSMDGAAAGIAAIASLNLFVFTLLAGGPGNAALALMLAGAALGFLVFNFPPARIFMGDSGSGFLGFTIATIAILGSYREVSHVLLTVLVPGFILAVPIFDTLMVMVTRAWHRRPIFQGGRDHPGHRLVVMGLPPRKAVLMLYALGALAGALTLAISAMGVVATASISIVLALGFVALGLVLSEVRVYDGQNAPPGLTVLSAPLNKRWIIIIMVDIVLVAVAYVGAHLLRYEGHLESSGATRTLPLIIAAKMTAFYLSGIYRGSWRYFSVLDLVHLARGVSLGTLLAVAALFVWSWLYGTSRTVLVIDWLLTFVLLGGSRLSLRMLREYLQSHVERGRRALIFGAGHAGTLLLRELRQNSTLGYRAVGFVDDEPLKQRQLIGGLSVLGDRNTLRDLIRRHQVEAVLLAAPSCPMPVIEEVVAVCQAAGIEAKRFSLFLEAAPPARLTPMPMLSEAGLLSGKRMSAESVHAGRSGQVRQM
ncbi:MAG: hypothetical protein ACRDFW_01495 [bacterium]